MIRALRATLRLGAAGAYLVALGLVHGIGRPFHRGDRAETWRRHLLSNGCRGVLVLLGIRVQVQGKAPSTPGILVTNHLGYLDILVLGATLDAIFVSRADVADWPGVGPLTRWSGTIFLDRERRGQLPVVVDAMRAALATGAQVVFFPEGTSGRGDVVMPLRSSLFEVARSAKTPVRAAALDYVVLEEDGPRAEDVVCWWGDMDFMPHLWTLAGLSSVRATLRFAEAEVAGIDRKQMARSAQSAIESVFVPTATAGESR